MKKYVWWILAGFVVMILLYADADLSKSRWGSYSKNFINACVRDWGEQARSGCVCALGYVQQEYSRGEAERFKDANGFPHEFLIKLQSRC